MKSRFTKLREFQNTQSQYVTPLSDEIRKLSGYRLLNGSEKSKVAENVAAAARYNTLRKFLKGYEPVSHERWVQELMDYGEEYKVRMAPLVLLRSGTAGIKSIKITDENEKEESIDNSKGLQVMERIYELWPEVDRWTEEKRIALFTLYDVGKTVSDWSREEVQDGKYVSGKWRDGLLAMRQNVG